MFTVRTVSRCPWLISDDLLYVRYHDEEWGVPVYEDQKIYEFLILEAFQAGLSWRTVLHKREHFRNAFADFDYRRIACFDARKIDQLMKDSGIIRHRQKIEAAINNAKHFMEVQKEFGSFSVYMWSWVGNKTIRHHLKTAKEYPVFIDEASTWAKDLKKRGFKFLGPTVLYAHMQAVGMVNDHTVNCFRYREL
jgi:DNA-3-methyladenine glycosylase I